MIKSINENIMKLYYEILDNAGIPINIKDNFTNDPLEFLKIVREYYEYTQNRVKEIRIANGIYMKNNYSERFFIEDDFDCITYLYSIFVSTDYDSSNEDKNYQGQSYRFILEKYEKQIIDDVIDYNDICKFNIDINFETKYLDIEFTDYTIYNKKIECNEFVEKYNEYQFPWNINIIRNILNENNFKRYK